MGNRNACAVVRAESPKWLPWPRSPVLAVARQWEAEVQQHEGNPLANATFSRITNWEGTEEHAEISPDGRFVTFLADRAGQLDVWMSQVGTGQFDNLTVDTQPLLTPGNLLRSLGFNGDGSEIWLSLSGNPAGEKVLMPLTGGPPRPFLGRGHSAPSWSPDDARLAYIGSSEPGDPLSLADRTGADPIPIVVHHPTKEPFFRKGVHTHNPAWSPDGRWIYFVHGTDPFGEMEVWRMQPSGELPEQLTLSRTCDFWRRSIAYLLYVALPSMVRTVLWALDVETKVTRR